MPDMRHMKHLGQVAETDVWAVQQKEATYQGSWKAAGGRSAWFMLRRKMDRLVVMLRAPEPPADFNPGQVVSAINDSVQGMKLSDPQISALAHVADSFWSEDIFQLIASDPSGSDGTVLAEVRDLRRYLLLVEAEMVARGVVRCAVRLPPQPAAAPPEMPAPALPETEERLVPRRPSPAASPAFGLSGAPEPSFPRNGGTPEDGGHHARYRLVDGLTLSPNDPRHFTVTDPIEGGMYWNVWRPDFSPDEVDHLQNLRLELNHKEWEETPPEYRGMYDWLGGECKYRLRKPYQEAWCETG